MKYSRFEETWENKLFIYKQRMIDYENNQDDDMVYTDIILANVLTSVTANINYFWAEVYLNLIAVPEDDDSFELETKYNLTFNDDNKLVLEHDRFSIGFDEIWNTPNLIESDLIRALINDMIEKEPKCMLCLTESQMNIILDDEFGYVDFDLIPEAVKIMYAEKFNNDDFLPKEVKEIFIF